MIINSDKYHKIAWVILVLGSVLGATYNYHLIVVIPLYCINNDDKQSIVAILYNDINRIMSYNNHNGLSLDYNYSITIMIIRQVVLQLIVQRI